MSNPAQSIIEFISAANGRFSIIDHAPVFTMADVERLTAIPRASRVKTIVVMTKSGTFFLCGIGEGSRLDIKAVARILGKSRADVNIATASEIETLTGVPRGAIGLILPGEQKQVLLSNRFADHSHIYCGVGRNDQTLCIVTSDLLRICNVQLCDIEKSGVDSD